MTTSKRRRTGIEIETARMERARDLLQQVVADLRRHRAVTPEAVATVSSVLMTVAMLEHEIGRRTTGSLKAWERARDEV